MVENYINNDNEQKLENFINKISQNLNENSNPNNINKPISKLQIMYLFKIGIIKH